MSASITHVSLGLIDFCPEQPRKSFDDAALAELAASIAARGLDTPITLRPVGGRFQIVAGERRFRACTKLGRQTIAALVRQMTERERDTAALVENVQRRDLTPMEEAGAYQRMLTVYGMSMAELAKSMGKAEAQILRRTRLLDLRPEYQQLVGGGQLPVVYAQELSRLKGRFQEIAFKKLTGGDCRTLRHAQAVVDALFVQQEQPELFGRDETGEPDEDEEKSVGRLERLVDLVGRLASAGFDRDGRITAAAQIPAAKAGVSADKLTVIAKSLLRLADELRRSAVQLDLTPE